MFGSIEKVWKDPVWSKVIAVGVLAAIAFVYEVITKKSLFGWVTNLIPLWWLFVTILIMLALFWLRNRWIATAVNISVPEVDSIYVSKIKAFNKLNIGTVQWRWTVEVSDKSAWPANYTPYCMKHDDIGSLFVPDNRLGERWKCIRCNSYILTENEFRFNFQSRDEDSRETSKSDAIQKITVEFARHLQIVNKEFSQS